jgi:DNA ligase (NAD+)
MKSCSKLRKAECIDQCTWTVGKGCGKGDVAPPIDDKVKPKPAATKSAKQPAAIQPSLLTTASVQTLPIKELVRIKKLADKAYYNTQIPIISDAIYDAIKDRIEEIDPKNKVLREVGAKIGKKSEKAKLPYYMGSLDKVKDNPKRLAQWSAKHPGHALLSDKVDGVSGLFVFSEGEARLYTRGDGTVGQDISHLISKIAGIVVDHDTTETFAVRGEFVIPTEEFERIRAKNPDANPRSLVSGLVNAKTPDPKIMRVCVFVAYEYMEDDTDLLPPSKQFKMLKKLGFSVPTKKRVKVDDISEELLLEYAKKRRVASPYAIDGIVVAHDASHERVKDGNPTYAFAFKAEDLVEGAETTVTGIEWNVSKHGLLIPTILLKPVRLNDVTIQRASGIHARYIVDNGLGAGAVVRVVRSGDVIPKVTDVLRPAATAELPEDRNWTWDGLNIRLVQEEDESDDADLAKRRLAHFFITLGVEGLSEMRWAAVYDSGLKTVGAVLRADMEDFLRVEGFKEAIARKAHAGVQDAMARSDVMMIMIASSVLGRGFGKKKLASISKELPGILSKGDAPTVEELLAIHGVERKTAVNLLDGLNKFWEWVDVQGIPMKKQQHDKQEQPKAQNQNIANQVIVFSGFRNKDWMQMITDMGGEATDNLTKKTTMLVVKDPGQMTGKMKKAQDNGVRIIGIDEFAELLKP